MLSDAVVAVFALCALALVHGMPQQYDGNNGQDSSAGLPLIQFTNGGIRFNFGGYHAEAGLGGLLGGSRTGGGLHASAGTPWGAHAGAGLGGLLGGDNANAGGGLYARAGLGNGRNEVGAGLGGALDGSGRSIPARGGLYATAGRRGVELSSGPIIEPSGSSNAANITKSVEGGNGEKPSKGRTNIQIIAHKKPQKIKQVIAISESTEASPSVDPPANKEIREAQYVKTVPLASAELFGSVSLEPQPPASQTINKVKIITDSIEPAPPVPPLPSEANEISVQRVRIVRPIRKRFWGPRKQVIVEYAPSSEIQDAIKSNIQKRQAQNRADTTPQPANDTPIITSSNNGFFDDIFKIPQATLNAVNQFLNNNSG